MSKKKEMLPTSTGAQSLRELSSVDSELRRPSFYRVYLLNDDYTPMPFVVEVLISLFNKSEEEANRIMLAVHHEGLCACGTYTYEVAESKITDCLKLARAEDYPLQCRLERCGE